MAEFELKKLVFWEGGGGLEVKRVAFWGLGCEVGRVEMVELGVVEDEDPVCVKPIAEKECHSSCGKQDELYKQCVERIAKKGSGNCEAWKMDYWHCIDKCAAPKVFKALK